VFSASTRLAIPDARLLHSRAHLESGAIALVGAGLLVETLDFFLLIVLFGVTAAFYSGVQLTHFCDVEL
jgi:hypothetical protein